MKGNDSGIWLFDALDQFRSFDLTMTENVTSDDLHDHNNDFFVSHVMWHIKWKVMTSVFDLSMFYTNWRSFELIMAENVTSDDLHDHNNDFCLSPVMWHIKRKVMTSVFDQLEVIWPHHDRKYDLRWPPWPQQWILLIPCHVSYQRKGNDFSVRPFNVSAQLEVIWPHHDLRCDLRWLPWPQQWLFCIPCHVTYQMKGYDFSIQPFNVLDQLDLRWPPWPQQDFFVSHVTWHFIRKVMTSVFDLSMLYTNWRSFDLTMTENMTSDDLHDHNNDFSAKWYTPF